MSPIGSTLLRGLQALQGKKDSNRSSPTETVNRHQPGDPKKTQAIVPLQPRPNGLVIWASLNEPEDNEALISLLSPLRAEMGEVTFLVTVQDAHFLGPDAPGFVQQNPPKLDASSISAFLDHWKPDIAIWAGSDIEPLFVSTLDEKSTPMLWVNAVPPQERGLTHRFKLGSMRDFLAKIDTVLPMNGAAKQEFIRLGVTADKLRMTGQLLPFSQVPGCDAEERDLIAQKMDARPVWLAVGVDKAELDAILAAHRTLIRKSHRLLLVLIPNEPSLASDLAVTLEQENWIISTRDRDTYPHRDDQIFVVDRGDECGLWMHLASISFIGGTLADGAHQNPLESAGLGSVVLYGPNGGRHAASFERLRNAGAARKVNDAATLAIEIEHLLAPDKAAEMAIAAWDVTTKGADVSEYLVSHLLELLDEAEGRKVV
ncbi:glycosyltransferase N-terminal domain-containing protein [Aliiroseovarius sp. F20344]|uniref:3-deoxy-D-manno-octulosonic acid transferase n=1 Tax=Aliiroseovarius sp. F20344 TaxID=2926414 RepID=UPI001FF26F45|nr:glycosyltransferase N-terminal domain-containing protein [Aliiroseovarius sp. F20344]MCK0141295.1 hypothetical protein [Aliiroseovarius sp. F20344]